MNPTLKDEQILSTYEVIILFIAISKCNPVNHSKINKDVKRLNILKKINNRITLKLLAKSAVKALRQRKVHKNQSFVDEIFVNTYFFSAVHLERFSFLPLLL